jgi:hypothetical protein
MGKKIRLSMMLVYEYEPEEEHYEEGMSIEQMAEFDANQQDIKLIMRERGKYDNFVKQEIIN